MAIQNDNTILKKADLKAYHERIAPMLGGTFMVGTNNSDYYSTDEKIVGVWTNGKPVYQKVCDFGSPISFSKDAWTNTNVLKAGMDTVIKTVGLAPGAAMFNCFNASWDDPSSIYLQLQNVRTNTLSFRYLIIQYTKTTDAAGSATTTPGAYDINFPNTWPANTEIYFGNGMYGYRWVNSSVTFSNYWYVSASTNNGIKAGDTIISYGGNAHATTSSGSSAISAFYVDDNNTVAFKWDWSGISTPAEINAWYTYSK